MTWDPSWERIFASRDWGKYPPEELVRFVARNFYSVPNRSDIKLLEIGCGTGANVWFVAREGFSVCGVDGSKSAIDKARRRLAADGLTAQLEVADLGELGTVLPNSVHWHGLIDVCCLQHNSPEDALRIFKQASSLLTPGAKVFSMLISEQSKDQKDINRDRFKDLGFVHFFTLDEVHDLFADLIDLNIEYSLRTQNGMRDLYKHWIVTGTKP